MKSYFLEAGYNNDGWLWVCPAGGDSCTSQQGTAARTNRREQQETDTTSNQTLCFLSSQLETHLTDMRVFAAAATPSSLCSMKSDWFQPQQLEHTSLTHHSVSNGWSEVILNLFLLQCSKYEVWLVGLSLTSEVQSFIVISASHSLFYRVSVFALLLSGTHLHLRVDPCQPQSRNHLAVLMLWLISVCVWALVDVGKIFIQWLNQ